MVKCFKMVVVALVVLSGAGSPAFAAENAENIVFTTSFEEASAANLSLPSGWTWDQRNTDSSCQVDTSVYRFGSQSVRMSNKTAFGPSVYGMLYTHIQVKPNTTYLLSCYARGEGTGTGFIGGGDPQKWEFRLRFPEGTFDWRRVLGSYTTGEEQTDFLLMVVSESPTTALWIDAVQLEEIGKQEKEIKNLAPNSSFEEVSTANFFLPSGWTWDPRNTDSSCQVDTSVCKFGSKSVRMSSKTASQPNVYGMLHTSFKVKPNTTYTLSCYAKGEDVGVGCLLGLGDPSKWEFRLPLSGTYNWRRISGTYLTGENQTLFLLGFLITDKTEALWIDGVQMEEGGKCTPFAASPTLEPSPFQE